MLFNIWLFLNKDSKYESEVQFIIHHFLDLQPMPQFLEVGLAQFIVDNKRVARDDLPSISRSSSEIDDVYQEEAAGKPLLKYFFSLHI